MLCANSMMPLELLMACASEQVWSTSIGTKHGMCILYWCMA